MLNLFIFNETLTSGLNYSIINFISLTSILCGIFVSLFLAEYASIVLICILTSILFLGGYLLDYTLLSFILYILTSIPFLLEYIQHLILSLFIGQNTSYVYNWAIFPLPLTFKRYASRTTWGEILFGHLSSMERSELVNRLLFVISSIRHEKYFTKSDFYYFILNNNLVIVKQGYEDVRRFLDLWKSICVWHNIDKTPLKIHFFRCYRLWCYVITI